jgi:hypothetical protein
MKFLVCRQVEVRPVIDISDDYGWMGGEGIRGRLSSRLHNAPCPWWPWLRRQTSPCRSCSSSVHRGSCRFDLKRQRHDRSDREKEALDGMMDGINTEGNVGVLVPDGITVFLDHDVSHPTYHLTSQSARGQGVLEQRTCRQRDHAWVRWGLRQCQWMR